jgi:hypothetical protein
MPRQVICAGVNADFQQCRSRRLGMDTSVWLGLMRSSSLFQSADSTQVTMPADPPQDHLDPHVLAAILRLQVLWYNSVTGHGQMFWKGTARSGSTAGFRAVHMVSILRGIRLDFGEWVEAEKR